MKRAMKILVAKGLNAFASHGMQGSEARPSRRKNT
jgi:hypothetical protein